MKTPICQNEQRREEVRRQPRLNGLDYLEVGSGQRTLTVYFLGKAPVSLDASNVVIEGGRRIRDVRVKSVAVHRAEMAELDDSMEVVTDKAGDFSTYTLRVVARDERGDLQPHPSFDPRYDRVQFSFKVDCPSDLDCKPGPVCPPEKLEEPEINYLAKDYASFRRLILDRLALTMPDWRERHVPDLGIALVEVLAYAGDHLSYYQDAVATEAYLDTARQRISVRRHARLVDYTLHEGCNSRTWVCVQTDGVVKLDPRDVYFITRTDDLERVVRDEDLRQFPSGRYEVFEPMATSTIELHPDHYEIRFYTWGDSECCLGRGARSATLIGKWVPDEDSLPSAECDPKQPPSYAEAAQAEPSPELRLRPGDVLIFEEVIGPSTGNRADADPAHRHPVRLVSLESVQDPLRPGLALTEITWADEDALPFPLCLSAMGPPPDCKIIEDVSVARANLVLVDHGGSLEEDLGDVPVRDTVEECDCTGEAADVVIVPDRYQPALGKAPLTHAEPLAGDSPAAQILAQDPRRARPQVALWATAPDEESSVWTPQPDLLESLPQDHHFVVETDNDSTARLRFGDDQLGRRPAAGTRFRARYRVGNGPAGNVGSESIGHLVTRKESQSGGIVSISNPLPARGGTSPEPIAEAKLFAPHAFRRRLERAITAEDYAAIVVREFGDRVQRAAATLRWNGSWHEVLVAVDPLGAEEADPALLEEIAQRLHRYRRIGHNLVVRPARRVPIDLGLLVCVSSGYFRGHVKAALLDVFSNRRMPDGRLGLFHADALTFGEGLYLSAMVAAAQAVGGVESVRVTRFQRLYEAAAGEIENGVLPLGPLEIARLDNDPSFPENGRLRLDLRGGR